MFAIRRVSCVLNWISINFVVVGLFQIMNCCIAYILFFFRELASLSLSAFASEYTLTPWPFKMYDCRKCVKVNTNEKKRKIHSHKQNMKLHRFWNKIQKIQNTFHCLEIYFDNAQPKISYQFDVYVIQSCIHTLSSGIITQIWL